jgi:XTP/dITP diphosphohydrolase
MSSSLIFASANAHKIQEISRLLPSSIPIRGLAEIGCVEEIPETQDTVEGNALQKARYVLQKYHADCFAEDTGLEIEALNGRPGVYSARYAGPQRNNKENMDKVLLEMEGMTNRKARFKTVVALCLHGKELLFEGIIKGNILASRQGTDGFGYDPIFMPEGYTQSFAEMTIEEKNKISHRALAINKLIAYLSNE